MWLFFYLFIFVFHSKYQRRYHVLYNQRPVSFSWIFFCHSCASWPQVGSGYYDDQLDVCKSTKNQQRNKWFIDFFIFITLVTDPARGQMTRTKRSEKKKTPLRNYPYTATQAKRRSWSKPTLENREGGIPRILWSYDMYIHTSLGKIIATLAKSFSTGTQKKAQVFR